MVEKLKKKYFSYNSKKYENILEDPSSKLGELTNSFITLLVVLFAFILIFESIGNNEFQYKTELFVFDAFISVIFGVEYIYRLIKAKVKTSFFLSPMRIVDFLSFAPFFIGLFPLGDFVKALRLFRVLRVLRLIKKQPMTRGFIKSLNGYLEEYKAVFILFMVVLFIGSFFVYFFEKDLLGTKFTSMPASLWWGLVTMTTVGYGDMVPLTPIGRIFGSILVFLGPLVLAMASAITVMVLVETSSNQRRANQMLRGKECHRCSYHNHNEANYCAKCGKKVKEKKVKKSDK